MKQIIQSFKTGEIWLADVPVPILKPEGVVVETHHSFISSGTEKMLVSFAQKNLLGKACAMPDQVKKVIQKIKTEGLFETWEKVQAKLDQPIPLGYSCAGVVVEVGQGVKGLVNGDRVACAGAGYANHAEFNYVPKNLLVKIPDKVSFRDASCATVGAIALQGVRQCDVRVGETVCVMGLGLLGLFAVQILKASGAKVVGFDPDARRCSLAQELGADSVVKDNLVATCDAFSKGNGVDGVLITAATNSNEPVELAGQIARHKGKVVVTGMVGMNIPRDVFYKKELDFKLSMSYGPGRYDTNYEEKGHDYPYGYVRWTEQRNIEFFLDLIADGHVTPSKMITHEYDIAEGLKAYDLLLGREKSEYLGIVIGYGKSDGTTRVPERKVICGQNHQVTDCVVGMIGMGNFAKAVLLPALQKQNHISLRCLCATTGIDITAVAKKTGFEYVTTDSAELFADPRINTVVIATRHDSHAGLVVKALEAGKNVFVEKPLALNRDELEAIKQAVQIHSGILTVGFNRRFSPHAKLLRDYLAKKTSPAVVNYRINAGHIPYDSWVHDPIKGGGRIIGEVCHFIDFVSYILSAMPRTVQACSVGGDNAERQAADNVSINIEYSDGSLANFIYTSFGSRDHPKEQGEIFVDESVCLMKDFVSTECFGKLGRKKLKGKQSKGFQEEFLAFFSAVINKHQHPIPLDEIFVTTEATFLVSEAIKTRETLLITQ
ncbi:MAG TPA: bi-domain-containing oxidoreductase [bacterium]|nr:bi-domain-containing oxidoreductase [bacterium]